MSFDSPTPAMTAWIASPCASASESRFSTKMPAPSPTISPSAAASNGEHRPDMRKGAELREPHLRVLAIGPGTPAREHRVGAAREEFVGRELDRVQRRRARRVERVAPAAETEPLCQETGR